MKFRNPFRKRQAELAPAVKPEVVEHDPIIDDSGPSTFDPTGLSLSIQRGIDSYAVVPSAHSAVGDATYAVDAEMKGAAIQQGAISPAIASWYNSQGFIGHQMCATIAQHWLVGKACSMAVEDAARNGWDLDFKDVKDKSQVDELTNKTRELDKKFKTSDTFVEAGKFANIFGIRILIPIIESADHEFFEKPFNIDGVTEGSFRGWSQVDPQWIFPLLDTVGVSNPASPHFYEPTFWITGGKKYHRSHLVILRTDEPADILKPSYMFGGVPLTQRIAERVYAAERTANEAPLLAMSKRTTSLKVDLAKAGMKKNAFFARINEWVSYRDNFGIKVLGKDEEINESDTSLADLDVVTMTQYQIVAAIAKTPSTKLLGTSPKGFNATGDHELKSYHEHLETLETCWGNPFLDRHYLLLSKSYLGGVKVIHTWLPVDSIGAEAAATIQKTKADTGALLIDKGVISPDEERQRIRLDADSGYTLEEEEAPGPPQPAGPEGGPEGGQPLPEEEATDEAAEEENDSAVVAAAIVATAATIAAVEEDKAKPRANVVDLVHKLVTALTPVSAEGDALPEQTAEPSIVGVKGVTAFESPDKKSAGEEAVAATEPNKPALEQPTVHVDLTMPEKKGVVKVEPVLAEKLKPAESRMEAAAISIEKPEASTLEEFRSISPGVKPSLAAGVKSAERVAPTGSVSASVNTGKAGPAGKVEVDLTVPAEKSAASPTAVPVPEKLKKAHNELKPAEQTNKLPSKEQFNEFKSTESGVEPSLEPGVKDE